MWDLREAKKCRLECFNWIYKQFETWKLSNSDGEYLGVMPNLCGTTEMNNVKKFQHRKPVSICQMFTVNSLRQNDAYIHWQSTPPLVMSDAWPVSESVLAYCQLHPREQTPMIFQSKFKHFHSKKVRFKMTSIKRRSCLLCLSVPAQRSKSCTSRGIARTLLTNPLYLA